MINFVANLEVLKILFAVTVTIPPAEFGVVNFNEFPSTTPVPLEYSQVTPGSVMLEEVAVKFSR